MCLRSRCKSRASVAHPWARCMGSRFSRAICSSGGSLFFTLCTLGISRLARCFSGRYGFLLFQRDRCTRSSFNPFLFFFSFFWSIMGALGTRDFFLSRRRHRRRKIGIRSFSLSLGFCVYWEWKKITQVSLFFLYFFFMSLLMFFFNQRKIFVFLGGHEFFKTLPVSFDGRGKG